MGMQHESSPSDPPSSHDPARTRPRIAWLVVATAILLCPWTSTRTHAQQPSTQPHQPPQTVPMRVGGEPTAIEIDGEPWRRYPILSDDDLEIALLVRPVASPADARFIGFEFVNRTDAPIELRGGCNYRIDGERSDRATGRPLSHGGIASGNEYDLLHRDVIDIEGPRRPIPPGTSRRLDHSSGIVLSTLEIPEQAISVAGRLHLTLNRGPLSAQRLAETPLDGVPFAFDWTPPDAAGRAKMQARLRALIRDPDRGQRHLPAMHALFNDKGTAEVIRLDDALAGLSVHSDASRDAIARFVGDRFAHDPRVIDLYAGAIAGDDRWREWLSDLSAEGYRLTDRRLIAPLLSRLTKSADRHETKQLLYVLSRHVPVAEHPDGLAARLSQIALPRCPMVAGGEMPLGPQTSSAWLDQMKCVGWTRDRSLVSRVVPYLDHRRVVFDSRDISVANAGDLRVCDVAYDTIVELLGRPEDGFVTGFRARIAATTPTTGPVTRPYVGPTWRRWPAGPDMSRAYAWRDAEIAKLRAELKPN